MKAEQTKRTFQEAALGLVLPDEHVLNLEIIGRPLTWNNGGIAVVKEVNKPTLYLVASLREGDSISWTSEPYVENDEPTGLVQFYKGLRTGELEQLAQEEGTPYEEFRDAALSFVLIFADNCFEYSSSTSAELMDNLNLQIWQRCLQ